jgi:uncharacterized protein YukJ
MVDYGVLKGRIIEARRAEQVRGGKPHYHVIVETSPGVKWRCPVNVRSVDGSEVWYRIEDPLTSHPILQELEQLPSGLRALPNHKPGLTLDYIREPLFDRGLMNHLPFNVAGPNDDIQDEFEVRIRDVQADAHGGVCVFGSFWRHQQFEADQDFGTDQGVHDVHMNQGNDSRHRQDDGIFQDGGLLFHLPGRHMWVGFFLAFNSQVWATDDHGHRLPGFPEGPRAPIDRPTPIPRPTPVPVPSRAEVGIVAALVNPVGDDVGHETVTVFNAGSHAVNLQGWKIVDRNNNADTLGDTPVPANHSVTIRLTGTGAQLGNQGGSIRLLDPHNRVVDSVTYSHNQAQASGVSVRF